MHPTRLSQNEQITHITLWSLVSSPLLIGCDMSEMDKFTVDGQRAAKVTTKWSDLRLQGAQPVRDLWQQKDLGAFNNAFAATVPQHGAMLLKIGNGK